MSEKLKFTDGLEALITCPKCGSPRLVVRTNTANGGQFLGCPNWPECKHTESIPESWKMRLMKQPEMFDAPKPE